MRQKKNKIYLVYKQTDIGSWYIVKAFNEESVADKYCKDQNEINLPEFDDYGYYQGVYHYYQEIKVE